MVAPELCPQIVKGRNVQGPEDVTLDELTLHVAMFPVIHQQLNMPMDDAKVPVHPERRDFPSLKKFNLNTSSIRVFIFGRIIIFFSF